MGKIINTMAFITLAYLLPLAGRPALIVHYKIVILLGAALAVFLSQPGFNFKEARNEEERDRN